MAERGFVALAYDASYGGESGGSPRNIAVPEAFTEDFSAAVWKLTGKRGADVVVDYSGKETWPGSIRCTTHGGRIVTCGATTGYDATTDLRYVWRRELDILGSDGWTREDAL